MNSSASYAPAYPPALTRTWFTQGLEFGYEASTGRCYCRINGRWVPSAPPASLKPQIQAKKKVEEANDDDEDEDDDSDDDEEEDEDEDEDDDDDDDEEAAEERSKRSDVLAEQIKKLSLQRRAQTDPGPTSSSFSALTTNAADIRTGYDPRTRVQSVQQYGPDAQITPPILASMGVQAHAAIRNPDRNRISEPSDSSFRRRDRPSRFFTVGKVFKILWAEPTNALTAITPPPPGYTPGFNGQPTFQKYRRFIVVIEGQDRQGSCIAVPILTHERRGAAAPGAIKSIHGIVYTGQRAPAPIRAEMPRPGEQGMMPIPIRVNPDNDTEVLDSMSRICYGKLYTIEHNLPVKSIGVIHDASKAAFFQQVKDCLAIGVPRRGRPNRESNAGSSSSSQFALANAPSNQKPSGQGSTAGQGGIPRRAIIANRDRIIQRLMNGGLTAVQAEERYQAMLAAANDP